MRPSAIVALGAVACVLAATAWWLARGALVPADAAREPPDALGSALERPTVAYSGRLRITAGVLTVEGPVHYRPEMEARSLRMLGTNVPAKTIVLRRDKGLIWVIDPATKSYLRAPLGAAPLPADGMMSGPLAAATKVGTETVDGIEAARFDVRFAERNGTRVTGDLWITADHIVLRLEGDVVQDGRTTPIVMALSELDVGPQPLALFEPPPDYTLVPSSHPTMGILAPPPTAGGQTDAD